MLDGQGAIEIDGERSPACPGSLLYVPRLAQHRFVDYPEGLTLVVFFVPAQRRG